MEKFTVLQGIVAPLDRSNVDTDAIIPKQFLKSIYRTGYGPNLFDEWRYLDKGEPGMDPATRKINPDFVLNQPRYQGSTILLARKNFGCGSSREHAPLAIIGAGIRAVVGHSFARIFYRNAFNMGLMLLEVGDEVKKINDGDTLEISPEEGIIRDLDNGAEIRIPPLSPMMQTLIDKGGMVNYVKEQLKMRGEAE